MVKVHISGVITRLPNGKEAYLRRSARNDSERRCKYGVKEWNCPTYKKWLLEQTEIKPASEFMRCSFGCNGGELSPENKFVCPEYNKRIERGKAEKTFSIKNGKYRQLANSAVYLHSITNKRLLFFTLTFPKFKKDVTVKELNIKFSQFIENLRRRYGCDGYIAVREGDGKSLRHHFHVVAAVPYIDLQKLNDYWCDVIADLCYRSRNAVTTDPKSGRIVKNRQRIIKYLCKYFSKARKEKRTDISARTVFISNNIQCPAAEFNFSHYGDFLQGLKGVYIVQGDYFTQYTITCEASYNLFFDTWLCDIFDLPVKNRKESLLQRPE